MITKQSVTNTPVAIAGISLGLVSLSSVWEGLGGIYIKYFAVLFACICISLLVSKLLLNPKKIVSELKDPLVGSLSFTTTMAIMAISNFIAIYNLQIARTMWLGAIGAHFMCSLAFVFFMKKDFKFENVVPSWFVPFVGICVAAVTGGPMGYNNISKVVFYYAFICLLILLPILIYRVKFYKAEIPQKAKMTLAIFAAPSSLCLAGYLGVFEPSKAILMILVPLAYILTLYLYTKLPEFISQEFTLGLAPLTFPLAIGVVATERYISYLSSIGSKWVGLLTQVFFIQLMIATLIIGYVVYKTIELAAIHMKSYDDENSDSVAL